MSVRKPEDLTLEEVREQMALYQRLYYHKVKETPEYKAKKADVQRQSYLRRKAKKYTKMSGIAKHDDIKNKETSVCKLKLLFANSCLDKV